MYNYMKVISMPSAMWVNGFINILQLGCCTAMQLESVFKFVHKWWNLVLTLHPLYCKQQTTNQAR